MNPLFISFLVLLGSYLLGSIPFGVLAGKLAGVDVRNVGSGNVGTTNVWRALGPVTGLTVFALDVLKGVAGPMLGLFLLGKNHPWGIALCALLTVLGHIFSVFLKFKGGKGIATGLGAMLGLWWLGAVIAFGFWVIAFLLSRMVSLASILACIFLPLLSLYFHLPLAYVLVITIFCLVAILKHIPNMKRIATGTESRVSFGRKRLSESTFEEEETA